MSDSHQHQVHGTPGAKAGQQRTPRVGVTVRALVWHEGHVLLMRGDDPGRPWYFLPGGHVEHGELMPDALRREVLEETGIHIIPQRPLYLREFIAQRHARRSIHMPEKHHVIGLLFLCGVDPAHHAGRALADIGAFPGDVDGMGGVTGQLWFKPQDVGELEIMPPHVKHALMHGFPPPVERGIEFWGEE